MSNVTRNWKTTALGLAAAFLQLWAGGMTPKNAAVAAALGLLGAAAKDGDKSGTATGA